MGPGYLPDRAFVRVEDNLLRLLLSTIVSHTTNLQEAFAITASNLCAVVIELAVVDILLVLSVDSVYIVLSRLLRSITTWLLGRLGATHDCAWHHLLLHRRAIVILLLLLLVHSWSLLLLMLLSSVHFCFFFSCQKNLECQFKQI